MVIKKENGPVLILSFNSAHQVPVLVSSSIASHPLMSPYSTEALFFLPTLSLHEDYTDFHAISGIYAFQKLLWRFLKFFKTLDTIHN